MLFSSENNCNSNIETIIKDKITLINNNNINNNLINTNLNNNNLTQSLTTKLDTQNNFKFNQDANFQSQHLWLRSYYRTKSLNSVNSLLLSPIEKENAQELIQQTIIDNAIIAQKIEEQNKELAHYLANIQNENQINDSNNSNEVLLPQIDLELISKNSNNLLLESGVNVEGSSYVNPNVSVNPLVTPEQSVIYDDSILNSYISSPEGINNNELLYVSNENASNDMKLVNMLSNNSNYSANGTIPYMSTPDTTILSSPLTNTILSSPITNNVLSSPESNILSSPELYDSLNLSFPESNLNDNSNKLNDIDIDNYLINQEILKLQQENMNSVYNSMVNQVSANTLPNSNLISSSSETTPVLLDQPLNIVETVTDLEKNIENNEINSKRKIELEDDEEENENNRKKSKTDSVINEGKPFIYVITEDEDDNNSGSEDDSQKKKKYKKKYYACSVCNHKSKRYYNVEVHLKIHEKNRPRPFECDICKKSFCRIHDLERHKVIHKEKMFACELCGKKFGRLDSLKRHVGCKTCIKRQQLVKNETTKI